MRRPAKLERVIDGDTIKVSIDLGFHVFISTRLRLARIDAPEMPTLPGQVSREFVVFTLSGQTLLEVDEGKSEKYGRWLAEVWFKNPSTKNEWVNLNDFMLASPHAKPYTIDTGDQ